MKALVLETILDQLDLDRNRLSVILTYTNSVYYYGYLLITLLHDYIYIGLDYKGYCLSDPNLIKLIIPKLKALQLDIERTKRYN